MNSSTALARLKGMTQWDVDPVLSATELDTLLSYAVIVDVDGREPDDDDYTPTYSAVLLNAAAAEGWTWKAGKLGDAENFSSDGATFDPQTRRKFMLDQAANYRKKVSGSAALTGRTSRFENTIGSSVVIN